MRSFNPAGSPTGSSHCACRNLVSRFRNPSTDGSSNPSHSAMRIPDRALSNDPSNWPIPLAEAIEER